MASGDTKTQQYLGIAANGTRADLQRGCCNTRTQDLIMDVAERIITEEETRYREDQILQSEIDEIKNNPDVVDIVPTYAALQDYDTSKLTDKDIIRVLADETHGGASTYYRWSTSSETFTYIGEAGDYYTKSQVDGLLDDKQDLLTAGANISISAQNEISATDTTYSDFTGTDGSTAGAAGLVPAPATTDADKYLKSDGTWAAFQGGGPTVVQTTGTSTTDVMSQNATTSMVYADPSTKFNVQIGSSAASFMNSVSIGRGAGNLNGSTCVSIGTYSAAYNSGGTALGSYAEAVGNGSVALGIYSRAVAQGEMNIGSSDTTKGYNNSNYRLLTGLYNGQSAHDAATYGQVISYSAINGAGAPTTATEGKYVGQLYYDTTNEAMYFLKAIDTTTTPATYTWEALGGGSSVNVVQTTGTSTTDVMSQNAVTSMVFSDPSTKYQLYIRNGYDITLGATTEASNNSIAIGPGAMANGNGNDKVAIGHEANTHGYQGAVALGAYSSARAAGVMDIGSTYTSYGYNSSNYRVLSGLYDPQSDHDAATKGYVDTEIAGAAATTINSTDWSNLWQ